MKKVAGEERGLARAALLGNLVVIGQSLFGSDAKVRLSDKVGVNDKHCDCLRDRHWRPDRPVTKRDTPMEPIKLGNGSPPEALMDTSQRKHTQRKVVSPIDIPVWDKARWGGTCYGWDDHQPPFMGLMFRDLEAGKRIFREGLNNVKTRAGSSRRAAAKERLGLRAGVASGFGRVLRASCASRTDYCHRHQLPSRHPQVRQRE